LKQAYDRQRQTKASATKAGADTTPAEDIAVSGEPAIDASSMIVADQGEPVAMPCSAAAILKRTFLDLWRKLSREEREDFLVLVDAHRETGTNKKRNLDRHIALELKDVDEGGNQEHFPFW
jgi:hypothetical protein